MQADQPQPQIGEELVHLLGIAHPADEIDVAGSAEDIRPHARQGGQHIAVVDHTQADHAGNGETAQRADRQPLADARQARLAPLALRRQQLWEAAQAQRHDQQAPHQQRHQAVAQPDMQRLGVVTAEVGAKKETGQQPVEQTETIESSHDGDPH